MKQALVAAVVFAALAVWAVLSPSPSTRAAAGAVTNEVVLRCAPNANQQVDPILKYGVAQSAHMHTPAGADVFSDSTTVAQMQAASTSCDVASDHSMMWFPTVEKANNTPATITDQFYYLTNQGYTLDANKPMPTGLRFIAGDSACASTSCDPNVIYRCINANTTTRTIPTVCNNGGLGFSEIIYSEHQCWDGQSLGQGMHPPPETTPNIVGTNLIDGTNGVCPAGWTAIPGFAWGIHVGGDGVGGHLSSDDNLGNQCAGCSGHFDLVNAQGAGPLSAVEQSCLNVATVPPPPVQATCIEKANPDGTSSLWARDSTGHYTVFVTS